MILKKPHIRLDFGRWEWFISESKGSSEYTGLYSEAMLWCRIQNLKEER